MSTPADLKKWARSLALGEQLSEGSKVARSTKGILPPNAPTRAYALGIGYTNGWWGHTGELAGYNVSISYRRDLDAVLVVSANRDAVDVGTDKFVDPVSVLAEKVTAAVNRDFPLP